MFQNLPNYFTSLVPFNDVTPYLFDTFSFIIWSVNSVILYSLKVCCRGTFYPHSVLQISYEVININFWFWSCIRLHKKNIIGSRHLKVAGYREVIQWMFVFSTNYMLFTIITVMHKQSIIPNYSANELPVF